MAGHLIEAEALLDAAKRLVAEERQFKRLSERSMAPDLSPKQMQKVSVDMNWLAFQIRKTEASVHALAVDLGIADVRDAEHYAESVVDLSGWHSYKFTPARPKALSTPDYLQAGSK